MRPCLHLLPLLFAGAAAIVAGCVTTPPPAASRSPFDAGVRALGDRDYEVAIQQLSLAIANAGGYFFAEAHLERGEAYLEQSQGTGDRERLDLLEKARADFARVSDSAGAIEHRARALEGLGRVYRALGKSAEAARHLEAVLALGPSERIAEYTLEASDLLGWIRLEKALEAWRMTAPEADSHAGVQMLFRGAQDHFARGLEIDPQHRRCNLGKGICLFYREQSREAIRYLRRSLVGMPENEADPRAHFYLARATESFKGLQKEAIGMYKEALRRDALARVPFLDLYGHLVSYLHNLPANDSNFPFLLEPILAYRGDEVQYWTQVEKFADTLVDSSVPRVTELGRLGRALARARCRNIDGAVEAMLEIPRGPEFLDRLKQVFPLEPLDPAYLYGRAKTLHLADLNAELDALFAEEMLANPDPQLASDENYQRTLVIRGRHILKLWRNERQAPGSLDSPEPEDAMAREQRLGKAKDLFLSFLTAHENDLSVRFDLGRVLEELESYASAFTSYNWVAKRDPTQSEAFRRIRTLYANRLLAEKDRYEAWTTLRGYKGPDEEIHRYVAETRKALETDLKLYCAGCGRKGSEGDVYCLECGLRVGVALQTQSTRRTP